MLSQYQTQEFMEYFSGSTHNFGEFLYNDPVPGQKHSGRARTVKNELVTIKHYIAHLMGAAGLGIIPVNHDGKCKFAVIDIDIYGMDLTVYLKAIDTHNLPILPFRSKSGGLHLYMFFKTWVSAKNAIRIIKKYADILGLTKLVKQKKDEQIEIFPKQSTLGKNAIGNWINLPYYKNGEYGAKAIRDGKGLSLTDALICIKEKQCTLDQAEASLKELILNDAPPCLQTIVLHNNLDKNSGRNNFLFSLGVYLKKKKQMTLNIRYANLILNFMYHYQRMKLKQLLNLCNKSSTSTNATTCLARTIATKQNAKTESTELERLRATFRILSTANCINTKQLFRIMSGKSARKEQKNL